MGSSDHNPHGRRLYLPIVSTGPGTSNGPSPEAVPAGRRPPWLKVKLQTGPNYLELKGLMREQGLHTVCEEAGCPNIYECWEDREATFLILGDKCTRRCGFCDVMTAKPDPVDEDEPARIAEAVRTMGLRYVVLTGVARDDLPDGGARMWAAAVRAVREAVPGIKVEVLPSDFSGGEADIATVIDAGARRVRPQPGDRPAPPPQDPSRLRLRALARGPAHRQAACGPARSPSPTSSWGWASVPRRSPRRCATSPARGATCSRSGSTCSRRSTTCRSTGG